MARRRAEVVREKTDKSVYRKKNSLFILIVCPYRPDASSLLSPSVLLLLFYFFLLSRLFCLQTGILHQRRVGLMVDGGIDAPQTHSSFHYL